MKISLCSLKALDLVALRELSQRTNVIPIIAKADTTSKQELQRFKTKILTELRNNNIEIYQFPVDDETVKEQNTRLNKVRELRVICAFAKVILCAASTLCGCRQHRLRADGEWQEARATVPVGHCGG